MDKNYSDVPDWLKRYCDLRGISVEEFFVIQEKWAEYFSKIREAFKTGVLDL